MAGEGRFRRRPQRTRLSIPDRNTRDRYTAHAARQPRRACQQGVHAAPHNKPPGTSAIDTEPGADEAEEAISLGLSDSPQTEFDRLLVAARREFFAAEGRFLT